MMYAWHNESVSPSDMEWYVSSGYSYTSALTHTQRDKQYFLSAQHVCLDFDTDDEHSLMYAVADLEFVKEYGSFIYTTMSHTLATPRCRVMFFLSEPMTDAALYEQCVRGMLHYFTLADQSTKDATRLYYGSKGCDIHVLRGKMELPLDVFLEWGKQEQARDDEEAEVRRIVARANAQKYGSNGDSTTYRGKLGPMLVQDVLNAPEGERNHTYFLKGVKARERLDHSEFLNVLEDLSNAALAIGLTDREVAKTKRQILKGNQS
jgi:hypothetical protein